jgi:lysophospholipase L1-like esterase
MAIPHAPATSPHDAAGALVAAVARSPWAPRMLRWLAYLVPVALTSGAAMRAVQLWREVERARSLSAQGRAFERRVSPARARILVLGDSTGVGIGASCPEDSIAGLLAAELPDVDIVNVSRSGARVADALAQARDCRARELHFELALLHVGGNDVIRATPAAKLGADSRMLLAELAAIADQTVWLGPPDVGLVPLFPPPLSWLLRLRTRRAAAAFAACAAAQGVTFVDFSSGEHRLRFSATPVHFAVDRLHPSSDTYRYGYASIRRLLRVFDGMAT